MYNEAMAVFAVFAQLFFNVDRWATLLSWGLPWVHPLPFLRRSRRHLM